MWCLIGDIKRTISSSLQNINNTSVSLYTVTCCRRCCQYWGLLLAWGKDWYMLYICVDVLESIPQLQTAACVWCDTLWWLIFVTNCLPERNVSCGDFSWHLFCAKSIIALIECCWWHARPQVKPLGVIWGKYGEFYNRKNTIMFDDIGRNFLMNPQNGLKVGQHHHAHRYPFLFLIIIVSKHFTETCFVCLCTRLDRSWRLTSTERRTGNCISWLSTLKK